MRQFRFGLGGQLSGTGNCVRHTRTRFLAQTLNDGDCLFVESQTFAFGLVLSDFDVVVNAQLLTFRDLTGRIQLRLDVLNFLVQSSAGALGAPAVALSSVPAQTVAQRPDVFAAERDVFKASALVAGAQAQRWPRLTISGFIGPAQFGVASGDKNMTTWSLGPVSLQLPVFDAGQRQANIDAAQSNFDSKVVNYQSRVRAAVREVEEALVQLQHLILQVELQLI
ncbi:hypothetical protein EBZ80_26010 [bacterium]|nr:hypothetical protein [bacterium]